MEDLERRRLSGVADVLTRVLIGRRQQSQRRSCDTGSMGSLEDATQLPVKGPRTRGCRQPLEAGTGKGANSACGLQSTAFPTP